MVFILSTLWWRRIRGLWKISDGRDWLRGKLGLVLMGGAMLSKSLIQFSVDGRGCVPSLLLDLRPNYGGGNEDNGALLQKVHSVPQALQQAPGWLMPLPETPGHSWACLGQFLMGSLLLSSGSCCIQGFGCALQSLFPQSCVSSCGSMVGLMATSSKRTQAIPRSQWKRPWCRERLKMGGEGDDRGWDGWMAQPTRWTWVWVGSGSWWWTRKPGGLQSMRFQRVGHDWVTGLNWRHPEHNRCQITFLYQLLI